MTLYTPRDLTYSTMNTFGSYAFPFALAAVLHVLVAFALITRWDSAPIEVTRIEPYYIDAALVSENPNKAKKLKAATERTRDQARQQKIASDKDALARDAKRQRDEAEKAKQALLEKVRQEEEKRLASVNKDTIVPKNLPVPEVAQPEMSEVDRLRLEQNLALAVMDEQTYRRAVTDDEKAMAYVAQIKREIVQNWSRPPSARNGMRALLKVRLVPTGEVVDVAVVKSSGNDAFDRSAILAVEKAERFSVPNDSRQFERNFREFEVLFRPEDLRL